jgi:penicillin-binding protein 2
MINFKERRAILLIAIGFTFSVFILRLFYLQVISSDFATKAERNVVKRKVLTPSRGILYDRNNKIYVTNTPSFDLLVIPDELYIPDTAIFERYLNIDRETFLRRIEKIRTDKNYNPRRPVPFEKYIDSHTFYAIQEQLWKCKGIYFEKRFTRDYLHATGANHLGYISEVNKDDINKSFSYYQQGDLIGTSGLERYYEDLLRGRKGVKMVMEDVHGREVGNFAEGMYDTLPLKGHDIVISIDTKLQEFGEQLMKNKKGSIVCIEPSSGEILAFINAPTYDPRLLAGTELAKNWKTLVRDTLKPLFNRPLMAQYPPGSIFKVMNALIALQEGTLTEQHWYGCTQGFTRNKNRPACHPHPTPLSIDGAIIHSCNAFFAASYVDYLHSHRFDSLSQAYNLWRKYMNEFGVGVPIKVDLPGEKKGLIPTKELYDKWYGKNRWNGMTIVSNSIGQGEVEMTPLQMANVVCAIANRGYYVQPHFFKQIYNYPNHPSAPKFKTHHINIENRYFELVADAMEKVVTSGTGYLANLDSISVCGKTGTAQNPHGPDHSVFFAFAPKHNPKIAVAVIVENATWGGVWAAPIAALMIEQYIRGKIRPQYQEQLKRILEKDFINTPTYFPVIPVPENTPNTPTTPPQAPMVPTALPVSNTPKPDNSGR